MGHHFHLHKGHMTGKRTPAPAKGWMGIRVGGEGEEQKKFAVPVEYLNHPLFVGLLKEAEEEYGFQYHEGVITIPCHLEYFHKVRSVIDRDCSAAAAGGGGGGGHHHHHLHGHGHHLVGCFRA
ncbi:auxin-responsive protein SAUR32-like [Dioscorea cayenensis subsp. rotundata]|uniref:Auxin-responsive protein SAUR32-like n=1 Tax=Dioscorea cayennensis subsp. rotundata TaxID=55577 RepID=A0AB40AWP9_DIOCR|nr:auxin-responsive protein SAUR32-like [Dioscorea cayenensis subsp. rotundata]